MVKQIMLVSISVIVAMMLMILPLPTWAIWLRPEWVLLVLVYWALKMPEGVSIGVAWLIGLFVDALQGTLLGEHALAFSVIAYFIVKFNKPIRLASMRGQMIILFLLVLLYQIILFWIQGLIGQLPNALFYWLSSLSSVIIWPGIYWLLNSWQQKLTFLGNTQNHESF